MNDIKQKFDPSTHMTVCGAAWEKLPIDLGVPMEMIIKSKDPLCSGDFILWVDSKGYARNRGGHRWVGYDLIPITHKPVDLPTNLREEIKYAAMDKDDRWYGFSTKPSSINPPSKDGEWWEDGRVNEQHDLFCHNIQTDPAGWENSLHIRTEDGWKRVL